MNNEIVTESLDPKTGPEWDQLLLLEAKVDRIQETLDNMLEVIQAVKDQVGPVIEEISNGPIGKILGMKRKDKTGE